MAEKENNKSLDEQTEVPCEEEPIVIAEEDSAEDLAQKQILEYKDMLQRLQAEFDNYRKRNNESVHNARNDGIDDVICALFPILDNFERGLAAIADENAKSGVELIYRQFLALFNKFNVEEIKALDEEFNPKYHHAIAQCEDNEKANKIVEVYQKGYKRKDKVLRPSMVKVAQ